MKKVLLYSLMAILVFSLFGSTDVQAGTKDMVATKREKFKDDSVESMRDVFDRRESEEKEYKKKMLSNSDKTIKLLTEIRDLLLQLNEKE